MSCVKLTKSSVMRLGITQGRRSSPGDACTGTWSTCKGRYRLPEHTSRTDTGVKGKTGVTGTRASNNMVMTTSSTTMTGARTTSAVTTMTDTTTVAPPTTAAAPATGTGVADASSGVVQRSPPPLRKHTYCMFLKPCLSNLMINFQTP